MFKFVAQVTLWLSLFFCAGLVLAEGVYRWTDQSGSVLYSYTHPGDVEYIRMDSKGNRLDDKASKNPSKAEELAVLPKVNPEKTSEQEQTSDDKRKLFLANAYVSIEELTTSYQKKASSISEQSNFFQGMADKLSTKITTVTSQLNQTDEEQQQKLQLYLENAQQMLRMYEDKLVKNKEKQAQIDVQFLRDKELLLEALSEKSIN